MKLATFEINGKEDWGFIVAHPRYEQQLWVFSPQKLNIQLSKCRTPTSSLWISPLNFLIDWPDDLAGFLAMEEKGMTALSAMANFVEKSLEQGIDQLTVSEAGFALSSVKLKAPLPRPRICFGLVQNGPSFIRNNPNRNSSNLFPQGHNRPQGTAVGYDDIIVLPGDKFDSWGYNVELAAVIGKKGRNISATKALDYVAGFMPLSDTATNAYYHLALDKTLGYKVPTNTDWFQEATMSWCGKMADTLCPMGPFLVTKDHIPNIYDLLAYTRQNGLTRDRAITGSYLLGIERIIYWYSSFGTLYPGDIIHLGTMAVDGLGRLATDKYESCDFVEVEIEKLGSLKNRVVIPAFNEWRDEKNSSLSIHPSPAVRDIILSKKDDIKSIKHWNLCQTRHYWTLYGNYKSVKEVEGLEVSNYPRMLNTPASSLGSSGCEVEVPQRATTLDIGIELACVIKKVARQVKKEDYDKYILGYSPLISISDRSFLDMIIQPATPQEQSLPVVYGRWADKFNIILEKPELINDKEIYNLEMKITAGQISSLGSSSEYHLGFGEILEFITAYTTLFPGDVITLGRVASRISVPAYEAVNKGIKLIGEITGFSNVRASVVKDTNRKSVKIVHKSDVHTDVK